MKRRGKHISRARKIETSDRFASWWSVAASLRAHQWVKNFLVFVPLAAAHQRNIATLESAALAFAAFCLCASRGYLFNDIIDREFDRSHPTKRRRAVARGAVSPAAATVVAGALIAAALALAILQSVQLAALVAGYFAICVVYSLALKKIVLLDVMVLAGLYVLRVFAGAVATQIYPSQWLLAFSWMIFLTLALVKRSAELGTISDAAPSAPAGRGYRISDIPIIESLSAAAGFGAVTIFSLYITSDSVLPLYRHPAVLWLNTAILSYWTSRLILLAHRGEVRDDPVWFALTDPQSLICGFLFALVVAAAI